MIDRAIMFLRVRIACVMMAPKKQSPGSHYQFTLLKTHDYSSVKLSWVMENCDYEE